MPSWFTESQVINKWQAVEDAKSDGKIPTAEFADACIAIISVFDKISGMGVAKSDMLGNANFISNLAKEQPGSNLQKLIEDEIEKAMASGNYKTKKDAGPNLYTTKATGKKLNATCALTWLCRALIFIKEMIGELTADTSKKLKEAVNDGYGKSLKPYHGMVVKTIFSTALKASPSRESFMRNLLDAKKDVPAEEVESTASEELNKVVVLLKPLLEANCTFLDEFGVKV